MTTVGRDTWYPLILGAMSDLAVLSHIIGLGVIDSCMLRVWDFGIASTLDFQLLYFLDSFPMDSYFASPLETFHPFINTAFDDW